MPDSRRFNCLYAALVPVTAALGLGNFSFAAGAHPLGDEFPIGLFGVTTAADMARVAADGFNFIQTYSFYSPEYPYYLTPEQYLQTADTHGLGVAFSIGPIPGESLRPMPTAADVQHFSQFDNLLWWYLLPEEVPYHQPVPFQALQADVATIHANDPQQRPVYMYLPTNYAMVDLVPYVPHLDVIGPGAYTNYALKPRPWMRWRIEQEVNAIAAAGNPAGKFPIATLHMFPPESPMEEPLTGADAYHDAYLSLVTGAKAIMILSDGYRNALDPGVYQSYKKVALELGGSTHLGEAFLNGAPIQNALNPQVTAGPQFSESFTTAFYPATGGQTIQYGSISHRVLAHDGKMYLAAVNSAEQAVSAAFPGIRTHGDMDVSVLFENRNLTIANRQFTDSFNPLGVHIYQLPASADLIIAEEAFNSNSGWNAATFGASITTSGGIGTLNRGSASSGYMTRSLTAGSLPEGGFLELRVQANAGTEFYLELVAPGGGTTSLINWRSGTGQMQTLIQAFDGNWRSSGAIWLGIRGGNSYLVDSLGIYFKPLIAGDADADGDVDLSDLSVLAGFYGKPAHAIWSDGDFDHDGDVDLNDLSALAGQYGAGQAQAMADFASLTAVPEPALGLLCPALATILTRRRR